jgi:hypothetical protein
MIMLGLSNLAHLAPQKKEYMVRQILTVLAGILLSVLAAAASGYQIYHFSAQWPQAGPALARYVVGPIIAVLVGVCVGILAKSHPGMLACLSLLPSSIAALAFRSLNFTNLLLIILLVAVEMLTCAAVAKLTFRVRRRTMQVAQ